MVPIIPPFIGEFVRKYKLTLSVTDQITNLVNQLFQLTPEEHRVLTLFEINI